MKKNVEFNIYVKLLEYLVCSLRYKLIYKFIPVIPYSLKIKYFEVDIWSSFKFVYVVFVSSVNATREKI